MNAKQLAKFAKEQREPRTMKPVACNKHGVQEYEGRVVTGNYVPMRDKYPITAYGK